MSSPAGLAKVEENLTAYVKDFFDQGQIKRESRIDGVLASTVAKELHAEILRQEKLIKSPAPK